MATPRLYIEPRTEIDCGYFLSEDDYVRGFLCLPHSGDVGRLRLVQDIPTLDRSAPTALPITLFDSAQGTPACLIDCFVTTEHFSSPGPATFPLALGVNAAIVGSDDADQRHELATLRCEGLLGFFEYGELTAEDVASGSRRKHRAYAGGDGWDLALSEYVTVQSDDTNVSMRWQGEITLEAADPRSLPEWGVALNRLLLLFAFLADQPMLPEHIFAADGSRRVDFYASWPEPSVPARTEPLVTLPRLDEDRFSEAVRGWIELQAHAAEFTEHVIEYQMHRDRRPWSDRVLLLCRCLELYHAYFSRVESVRPPVENRSELIDEVLGALPDLSDMDRKWITRALVDADRKPETLLAEKIADLLEYLGPRVLEGCGIADAGTFASAAETTWSHYTHPRADPPPELSENRDLVILVNRLWFVVRACVLVGLGFSREQVADALHRSGRRYLLSQ